VATSGHGSGKPMSKEPLVSLHDVLAPGRTALLVIDLQNDFIHPAGWAARHGADCRQVRRVVPFVNQIVLDARRAAARIAYVLMEHGPDIDLPNYRARYAERGMEDDILCRAGGWGAALDDAISPPQADDIVIRRHNYDGFANTALDGLLRGRGVETCVATGVVTNLCVQTTIHHAFALGYYVAVASDCVAATTSEAHEAALDTFRRFFGPVLPAREIANVWQRAFVSSGAARGGP
jgi:ureidoacrylate peracid hydrolase